MWAAVAGPMIQITLILVDLMTAIAGAALWALGSALGVAFGLLFGGAALYAMVRRWRGRGD